MNLSSPVRRFGLLAALCFSCLAPALADDARPPKLIFDPAAPDTAQAIVPNDNSENDVTTTLDKSGIDVTVAPNGKSSFPGIKIIPASPWDASGSGHLEVKITNTGAKPIRANLRIDNDGPWQENRWSANVVGIKPGQSAIVPAIFGYQYNKAGYALDPSKIVRAIIFIGKADVEQSFRVEAIQAAGPAGEKPYIDPNTVALKPPGGVMLGGEAPVSNPQQLVAKGGAKAAPSADGKAIDVAFSGAKGESALFKPVAGMWNLNQYLAVKVKVRNTGSAPVTPSVQLESRGGPSDAVAAAAPIAPGAEAEIAVPFAAAKPWVSVTEPDQEKLEVKKEWLANVPGTGTHYTSNTTTGITLLPDAGGAPSQLQVTEVVAGLPVAPPLPAWLGQKPPVEGDWVQTFNENFDGHTIDLKTWNIYTDGEWHLGASTHYSKDNVIVQDGKLALRVEKKPGHHNDNPKMPANAYATGYADTFGKWTQRYGYFEARMKLPTAPNMFLAFWLMPDRGTASGLNKWQRGDTKNNGMEFDIMETLSIWGPNRHDFGMHWDAYQKFHKSLGMFTAYVHPDAEGFITVGMLWLPGLVVMYDNGREAARWESPRISSVPAYFILDHITGGWETEPIDDRQLPADFVIDYVRAWQRKDLASPGDGPKPNDGGPLPPGADPVK